jgi:hypothetical protein
VVLYAVPLTEQHQRIGGFTASFTVLRLLTPLKMSYETAKKRAEPSIAIIEELPQMRQETVELVIKSVHGSVKAYVLVNNHAEGYALLTIQALVNTLAN